MAPPDDVGTAGQRPADEWLRGVSIYAVPLDDALAIARQDPMVRAGWFAIEGAEWHLAKGNGRFQPDVVDSRVGGSS